MSGQPIPQPIPDWARAAIAEVRRNADGHMRSYSPRSGNTIVDRSDIVVATVVPRDDSSGIYDFPETWVISKRGERVAAFTRVESYMIGQGVRGGKMFAELGQDERGAAKQATISNGSVRIELATRIFPEPLPPVEDIFRGTADGALADITLTFGVPVRDLAGGALIRW